MRSRLVGSCVVLTLASAFGVATPRIRSQEAPRTSAGFVLSKRPDPAGAARAEAEEAERERRRVAYQGLSVRPNDRLKGRAAEAQAGVIELLTREDHVPAERKGHFRWVDEYGGVITGWTAEIVDLASVGRGHVVTLKVHPRHTSGAAVLNGHIWEHYRIVEGRAEFLSAYDEGLPKVATFN